MICIKSTIFKYSSSNLLTYEQYPHLEEVENSDLPLASNSLQSHLLPGWSATYSS